MDDQLTPSRAPQLSRRQFFKTVGFGGALLFAGGGVAATWMAWMFPAPLVRSSFAPRVGDTFQVRAGPIPVALQLVGVRELGGAPSPQAQSRPPSSPEYSFAISFRGPAEQPLGQGTYEFVHGRMGSFPIFIVPKAAGQGARYYEAIFNRMQG